MHLAVPGNDGDRGAPALCLFNRESQLGGHGQAPVRHPGGPSDNDGVSVDYADDTSATVVGESLDLGKLPDDVTRVGRDRPGNWVLGGVLDRPRDAQ